MGTGAITGYVDVAQLVLYGFWVFFFGLIFWLQRESKREGYPMHSDRPGRPFVPGMLPMPSQKTYLLEHGGTVTVPRSEPEQHYGIAATPIGSFPGASLVPDGDQMRSGLGPGVWNGRADEVERNFHGDAIIQPLRTATGMFLAARDTDPRGLPVLGCDGEMAGTVREVWVDIDEFIVRYLEVDVPGTGARLVPTNFTRIGADAVRVQALTSAQFAGIPATREADRVTKLEEEKVTAWFGAGTLYATPQRQEALL